MTNNTDRGIFGLQSNQMSKKNSGRYSKLTTWAFGLLSDRFASHCLVEVRTSFEYQITIVRSPIRPANEWFMDLHDLHTSVPESKGIRFIKIVAGRERVHDLTLYSSFRKVSKGMWPCAAPKVRLSFLVIPNLTKYAKTPE